MGIAAGELQRIITIERFTASKDEFNADVETWAPVATVWARKLDVSDRERVAAAEVAAEITTRFLIGWRPDLADLNPKDRVLYAGQAFNISAVKEVGFREGIEISAAASAD